MAKLNKWALRSKLARKPVPFKNVVTEKITTNPDWANQNTRWGAHFIITENDLDKQLPDEYRGSLSKDYPDETVVVAIYSEVPEEKVKAYLNEVNLIYSLKPVKEEAKDTKGK